MSARTRAITESAGLLIVALCVVGLVLADGARQEPAEPTPTRAVISEPQPGAQNSPLTWMEVSP